MADELMTLDDMADGKLDLTTLKVYINGDENVVNEPRLAPGVNVGSLAALNKHVKDKVDLQIATIPSGRKGYKTYAEAQAAQSTLAANTVVEVNNDSDTTKNAVYTWDGTTLTKSIHDPLAQAKNYADSKVDYITSQTETTTQNAYAITDSGDKIAFKVGNDGSTEVAKLKSPNSIEAEIAVGNADIIKSNIASFEILDANDKVAAKVKPDGTVVINRLQADNLVNDTLATLSKASSKNGDFRYNIAHLEVLGQSLSLGTNGSPILTTAQKYDNVMFKGGIRKQHPNDTTVGFFDSFVPLIESLSADNGNPYVYGETPVGGASEQIKDLISTENHVAYTAQSYQLLGTASGEGGKRMHELRDTYVPQNLLPAITNAYNLAQAQSKTYGMSAIGMVHGEADNVTSTTIAQYKTSALEVLNTIDNHVKSVNNQTENVKLITSQLCSFASGGLTQPKIELALYQLAMENPERVYLACPLYIFDYTDDYHLNNVGSKWLGAYLGLVYKRVVIDGEQWSHIKPISNIKQGNILEIKFHVPVQPLVFDTTQVAQNTNYGFTLVDSANNAIAINSVQITQPDTVKFVTASPVPSGAKLRYAWTPVAKPSRLTGARGNLRDSQGDTIVFDKNGINKPMHNWTPIFEYTLN